ncbi:hypothetical protein Hanom_Chr07g00656891 [Helianthus anomalus]
MSSRYATITSGQKICFQQQFVNSGAVLVTSLCGDQVNTSPRLLTCIKQVYG